MLRATNGAAASLADFRMTDFTTGSLAPRGTLEWPALYAREQAAQPVDTWAADAHPPRTNPQRSPLDEPA